MSRTTACCHSRLASGPTRPLALWSTRTQAPKTMRCCRASSQGRSGPSPGAGVSSDKSMPDLLSELNRSFVVSSVRMSAWLSCGLLHSLRLGYLRVASSAGTWTPLDAFAPRPRPARDPPPPSDCLALKEKRIPVRSHVGLLK